MVHAINPDLCVAGYLALSDGAGRVLNAAGIVPRSTIPPEAVQMKVWAVAEWIQDLDSPTTIPSSTATALRSH